MLLNLKLILSGPGLTSRSELSVEDADRIEQAVRVALTSLAFTDSSNVIVVVSQSVAANGVLQDVQLNAEVR